MTPVTKRLGEAVLAKNLTIPLCPRVIVDAQGAALDGSIVGSVADLNAAVLAYFPFSEVKYCPDAFTPLPVTTLVAYGDPSLASLTQVQVEVKPALVLAALERYRAARQDGYSGYIHVGLLESSLRFVNPPSNDQNYSGTHGVTLHIGGLTVALFVPPSFTLGPIDYFQYHLIFLHELGHALGLAHAPGCGAAGYDAGYPYANGALPQDAADRAVTPIGAPLGTKPAVPLRGTIGDNNGYQSRALSNRFSVPYPGPAARNSPGTIYLAGNQQVIGNGVNEIPISMFQPRDLSKTQVYDLMNYCSVYFYNKWISDYSYRRIAAFSLDRLQADGSFDDLSGQVTFGNVPVPDNIE